MAGTGLPIPQSGVLAQAPGVIDGDRISAAQGWAAVARAGSTLADIGADLMQTQRAGYLADQENEARRKRIELQAANAFNPDGFDAAWSGFVSGKLQQMETSVAPHMQKIYDGEGTAAYASLTGEKVNRDQGLANESLTSRMKMAADDVVSLAANGRTDGPEFVAAVATWDGIAQTRVNSGFDAPDRVAAEREALLSRSAGENILFKSQQLYSEKGYRGAIEDVEKALEGAAMTPAAKRQYMNTVEAALRTQEITRRTDVASVMVDAAPVLRMLGDGVEGLEDEAGTIIAKLKELRAPDQAMKVQDALLKNQGYLRGLSRLPSSALGGSFLDKMTVAESGGDPNAKNPNSSATGQHQFIGSTWRDIIHRRRPDLVAGKTDADVLDLRTDPALSREMAGYLAEENAAALKAANLPVTDASQYLAWFAGAGGAKAILTADPSASAETVLGEAAVKANPFLRGKTVSEVIAWAGEKMEAASAANIDPAMLEGYREGKRALFDQSFPDLMRDAKAFGMSPDTQGMLLDMYGWLDEPRRAKMREAVTVGGLVDTLGPASVGSREAFFAELGQRAAAGDALSRTLMRELEETRSRWAEMEKTDPIARGQQAKWVTGPAVINWGADSAGIATQMQVARRDADVVARQLERAAVPALSMPQAAGLAAVLARGPAERASPTLNALQSSLSPEQFAETMAMPALRDALAAMSRTSDPTRLNAAFAAYDAIYQQGAAKFQAQFPGAAERLEQWQSMVSSFSPEEIARRMTQAGEPSEIAARAAMKKQGEELAAKVSASDVAAKFATTFSTPGLLPDAVRNETMAAEYRRVFAEQMSLVGDPGIAETNTLKRIKNRWDISPINGGRLTQRPPERYYPAVRGSHDWMRDELEGFLRKELNIPVPDGTLTAVGGNRETGRSPVRVPAAPLPKYGILADRTTEGDISSGRPPSYAIWIVDRNGQMKFIEGADGQPRRYAWDSETAVEAGRAWFNQARGFMQTVRKGQALDRELRADMPPALR